MVFSNSSWAASNIFLLGIHLGKVCLRLRVGGIQFQGPVEGVYGVPNKTPVPSGPFPTLVGNLPRSVKYSDLSVDP